MIIGIIPTVVLRPKAGDLREQMRKVAEDVGKLLPIRFAFVAGPGKRPAYQNAQIAERQQALGRDPWYVTAATMSKVAKLAGELVSRDAGTRRSAVAKVTAMVFEQVAANVNAQRNPDGGRFAPVTQAYARWKRSKGYGSKILVATGELIRTTKVKVTRGS